MDLFSQILGLFRVFQWWLVVAPWEQGLRVRIGKTATLLNPGIHFRIPFLDRTFVQSVRLRIISDSGQTMTTKDRKTLTIAASISFAVVDILKLYDSIQQPENTINNCVQGLIAEFVANNNANDITPAKIEKFVNEEVKFADWGIAKCSLMITTFAYVKVFRLMQEKYQTPGNLENLEQKNN